MTVSVDLTVAAKAGALTVRSDAVLRAATAEPYVFVVETGRIARKDIKVGIRGDGSTEILSGVDEGAEVVVSGAALEPGQRVRTSREDR